MESPLIQTACVLGGKFDNHVAQAGVIRSESLISIIKQELRLNEEQDAAETTNAIIFVNVLVLWVIQTAIQREGSQWEAMADRITQLYLEQLPLDGARVLYGAMQYLYPNFTKIFNNCGPCAGERGIEQVCHNSIAGISPRLSRPNFTIPAVRITGELVDKLCKLYKDVAEGFNIWSGLNSSHPLSLMARPRNSSSHS